MYRLLEELDKIDKMDMDPEQKEILRDETLTTLYAEHQPEDIESEGLRGAKFILLKDGTKIGYNFLTECWEEVQ